MMKGDKDYTIIDESKDYYILQAKGDQDPVLRHKRDYTPPKPAVWTDVTAGCDVTSAGILCGPDGTPVSERDTYRLVAVCLQQTGGSIGMESGIKGRVLNVRNVFIVERQEPA